MLTKIWRDVAFLITNYPVQLDIRNCPIMVLEEVWCLLCYYSHLGLSIYNKIVFIIVQDDTQLFEIYIWNVCHWIVIGRCSDCLLTVSCLIRLLQILYACITLVCKIMSVIECIVFFLEIKIPMVYHNGSR